MSENPPAHETPIIDDTRVNDTFPENTPVKTNTFYITTEKQGTIKVVEYFNGKQSYLDIIKAALRREFSE